MTRSLLLGALLAALAPALSAQPQMVAQTGAANPFRTIAAGSNLSPALGDLDADGDLDVLIGAGSGGLGYFRNDGGTFTSAAASIQLANSGASFSRIALADLDADGDLDLVVGVAGGSGPTLRYYPNTGTPTAANFGGGSATLFPTISQAGVIPALGDVDGDGDIDLVLRTGGTLTYLENTGSPAAPAFAIVTGAANPFDGVTGFITPALLDADGDGDLDLASGTTASGGGILYLENTPGGFVQRTGAANPYDDVVTAGLVYPAFGDVESDGDLDMLVGLSDGSTGFYRDVQPPPMGAGGAGGVGIGLAAEPTNPFNGLNFNSTARPALGDLDGDGDLDVVMGRQIQDSASDYRGILYVYRNDAGTFVRDTSHPFDGIEPNETTRPTLADLDGDGLLELVTGAFSGVAGTTPPQQRQVRLRVYQIVAGTATELTGAANPFDAFTFGSPVPTLGDIDGDGDADLIVRTVVSSANAIRFFLNTPGGFVEQTGAANPFATETSFVAPYLGDLDGDGDIDLVGGQLNGDVFYYENTPTGFGPRTQVLGTMRTNTALPAIGNLDADADIEALIGNLDGTVDYFEVGPFFPVEIATVQLTGAAGWRMVSAPGDASLRTLLDDPLWIQGVPGSDEPAGQTTLFRWDELTQSYVAPSDMDDPVGFGTGVWVYAFDDDDPLTAGTQGGFPKVLGSPGLVPRPFLWSTSGGDAALSFTDDGDPATTNDGYNVLGVPGTSWLDWDSAVRMDVDPTVYVYDPAVASYRTYTQGVGAGSPGLADGIIAPFQGFWVQTQAAAASLRMVPGTSNGGPFQGKNGSGVSAIALSLRPDAGSDLPETVRGGALVAYGVTDAADGYGLEDGEALGSPAAQSVSLRTLADGVAGPVGLSVDLRPDLDGTSEVALAVSVVGADGAQPLVLSWPELRDVPADWTLTLHDAVTGAATDLRTATEYAFATEAASPLGDALALVAPTMRTATDSRFTLVVSGVTVAGESDADGVLALDAPRPNPATTRTEVPFTLAKSGAVRLAVYDALGREVAVLADGERTAGSHSETLDASALAAGVYVVRLTTPDGALVRRITIAR